MTKDEMKNRISMALKDPVLQQGFEIICKENAELKEKLDAIDKAGEHVRQQINDSFRDKPSYAELEKENVLLKGRTEGFEKQIMGLLIKYEKFYKRFPDLKDAMSKAEKVLKENAELNKTKEEFEDQIIQMTHTCQFCFYRKSADQLTKAKKLLKKWVYLFSPKLDDFPKPPIQEETEAFLEEEKNV